MKLRGKTQVNKKRYFIFRGFIRCGECGGSITAEIKKGHHYYRCTKRIRRCSQRYVREEELARQIQAYIQKVSLSDDWLENILRELEKDKEQFSQSSLTHLQNLNNKILDIDRKISKLIDVYLDGALTLEEYQLKKNSLINEKKDLQEKARDFADEGNNWLEPARCFVTSLNEAHYALREGNLESQKEFLKKIGSNFILKERRLIFSTEGTFRPVLDNAPFPNWWRWAESNRRP